jgi:hypothetical protein
VSKQANIIDRHTSSCMIESKAGEWDMYCPPLDRAILIISKPIFCARRVRNCTLVLDMDVVSVNKSSWCLTVGGKNRGQTLVTVWWKKHRKQNPTSNKQSTRLTIDQLHGKIKQFNCNG